MAPGASPSLPQCSRIRKGLRHLKQRRARGAREQSAVCVPRIRPRRARATRTWRTAGGGRAASGVTGPPPPLSGAVWLPEAQTPQTLPGWGQEGRAAGGGPCLTWRVVAGLADGGRGTVHEVKRAPCFHLPETGTLPMAARDRPVLPQARRAQVPPQQRAPHVSSWVACDEVEPPQGPDGTVRPTRSDPLWWFSVAPGLGDTQSPASVV